MIDVHVKLRNRSLWRGLETGRWPTKAWGRHSWHPRETRWSETWRRALHSRRTKRCEIGYAWRLDSHASPCRHTSAWSDGQNIRFIFVLIDDRGWSFHAETDHRFSSQYHQTQTSFHFLHRRGFSFSLFFLRSNTSKFFTIREDQVHVSVESEHLADKCTAIVYRDLHPPVDETKHFATFRFWGSHG